jgi:hypothetical protein
MAVTEYRNANDIGQYKSLTDVTKTVVIAEDIDYHVHVRTTDLRLLTRFSSFAFEQEFQNQSQSELRDFICNTDVSMSSLRRHTLATYELSKQGGLDWMIRENYRVRNHLEYLMKEASACQHW